MPLSKSRYAEFKNLIDAEGAKNEKSCQRFLPDVAVWLCPQSVVRVVQTRQEDRIHYGSSDCIYVVDMDAGRGTIERFAYTWEVKAPQCYLVEFDHNTSRCRPTMDLVRAENQLLHYYQEVKGSEILKAIFGIVKIENIKIGGIIIGRQHRILRNQDDVTNRHYAETAMRIREDLLYKQTGLRVHTWDYLDRFLGPGGIVKLPV